MRQQTSEAAASVASHIGHWLECRNGKCGFPVRLPYSAAAPRSRSAAGGKPAEVLFACPVCLEINAYSGNDLRNVQFRSPDPYEAGKLVLYSVLVGCAQPRCQREAAVMTAAASNVSLAALLRLWKGWKVDFPCDANHRFRPRHPHTWWIERERSLPWRSA